MASLDLLQGTADLLILKTLSWGPAHGYAIARWIERLTDSALEVGEGSLYPACTGSSARSGWPRNGGCPSTGVGPSSIA